MSMRWGVLALLFAVRTAMAVQYQSVAAVAPLLMQDYLVGIADIGLLIGLYLAPGMALALPGGALGRAFGDKRCVMVGLALMTVGGIIMGVAQSWSGQITGRLIAGIGGVLLNVLMSKMIADWFAGREIATAMAIFVNSWPVGIALGLVGLPLIAVAHGVPMVFLICTALVFLGLIALAWLYREPPNVSTALSGGAMPDRATTMAVVTAGLTWSLYNAGFAMVFGFGPSMLVERGWTIEAAGSTVSLALWLVAVSVPVGGYIADRGERPIEFIVAGCLAFAALLVAATRFDTVLLIFAALGIVAGLPAGAIMSLPARILGPGTRAVGMGIYFTVFYIGMVAGPLLGGAIAGWLGASSSTFDFGAILLLCSCLCVWLHQRQANSIGRTALRTTPEMTPP
ncbi:MAG: MFS transporter [Hyphomicrobiaceae bacterium]|nr:MAG: MFS transporter [Hyphomicrobiaceae bacterium]